MRLVTGHGQPRQGVGAGADPRRPARGPGGTAWPVPRASIRSRRRERPSRTMHGSRPSRWSGRPARPPSPTTPASRSTRSGESRAHGRLASPVRLPRTPHNVAKLLEALEGETDRRARFRTVVVCRFPDGARSSARALSRARSRQAPRGRRGVSATTRCSRQGRWRPHVRGDEPSRKTPPFSPGSRSALPRRAAQEKCRARHNRLHAAVIGDPWPRAVSCTLARWRFWRARVTTSIPWSSRCCRPGTGSSSSTGACRPPSVVSAREMAGLEYSIDLLSEPKMVRRILEGEAALPERQPLHGRGAGRSRPRRAVRSCAR